MSSGLLLLIAALLVLLNGFFVAAEYSLVKIRSTRVEELVRQGSAAARVVRRELGALDRYLSATQFGITLSSLGLGWAGEGAVPQLVAPGLKGLGVAISPALLGWLRLGWVASLVAFCVITSLHIVAGEQVPKIMAIQRAERVALFAAYPLRLFYRIFNGPILLLAGATRLVARACGLQMTTTHELAHSEEELRMILTASQESGVLRQSELDLVEHVFVFADKRAREVMVPRVDMVYLSTDWSFEENFRIATSHSYTRFPLCEGDPDHVIGLIHIRDLLPPEDKPDADLRPIRRQIVRVPDTKPTDQLLREFQYRKIHMAVVLDEYGGTAGIATLEDVLEEIVGDIHDEFEEPDPEVRDLGDRRYLVHGKVSLSDLRNDLGIDLPADGVDTIGGWVLDQTGAIPTTGTVLEVGPHRLEVTRMEARRVREILITKGDVPAEAEEGEKVA